jgi:prepilin-type N-terminal cleavage/methylation domain-containing protein
MKRRKATFRGFTLIELLVVMSVVALLMALVSLLVSATLQTQRQTLLRERQRQEYFRLDTILRSDAHSATEVTLLSPTECDLANAQGERWTYRTTDAGLVRERFQGEKRIQREVFYVRPGTTVKFHVDKEHERSLLQLHLDLPVQSSMSAAHQAPYRASLLVGGALPSGRRPAAKERP